jgi:hypothetical protein
MKQIQWAFLTFSMILLTSISLSFAQETAQPQPELTEEQKILMANMQAYSTPNENHALLAKLAGDWDVEVSIWMDPAQEANVSQGTASLAMIYGGRYLEQIFKGTFEGQPYEGRGLLGYDNIQKEFQSIWHDNMGTGIMFGKGRYDAEKKTITEENTVSCPITNSARWHRTVTTFIDDDHYTYESFMKDVKTDEPYRSMLIKYSRKANQE